MHSKNKVIKYQFSATNIQHNSFNYKMFLDLEMSMHPYKVDKSFIQEVIQVGYVIVDEEDNIVEKYNQTIQVLLHKKILVM